MYYGGTPLKFKPFYPFHICFFYLAPHVWRGRQSLKQRGSVRVGSLALHLKNKPNIFPLLSRWSLDSSLSSRPLVGQCKLEPSGRNCHKSLLSFHLAPLAAKPTPPPRGQSAAETPSSRQPHGDEAYREAAYPLPQSSTHFDIYFGVLLDRHGTPLVDANEITFRQSAWWNVGIGSEQNYVPSVIVPNVGKTVFRISVSRLQIDNERRKGH